MQHTYYVSGMTCAGCKDTVTKAISSLPAVTDVQVDIKTGEVLINMDEHISLAKLEETLLPHPHYKIYNDKAAKEKGEEEKEEHKKASGSQTGKFYCPMHCEGEKMYDKPGDCPVCGMNLEKAAAPVAAAKKYTCPMHPEIVEDKPGSCPICGMDLVPMAATAEAEDNSVVKELSRKFWIAVFFTIPVFIIAMGGMIPGNPLPRLLSQEVWDYIQLALSVPVIFYSGWMFFKRAYRSIRTWNLNMFTLIGIGTGVAFLFSLVGLFFPDLFPAQFKSEEGSVFLYFEAATVIITLVLLGQLMEAKAHSRTNGAIKELLNLVPAEAILVKDGQDKIIAVEDIKLGDILRVKPGGKIAVDGVIMEGVASIDESMITGEPIPADKGEGDKVSSGTINSTRSFTMKAEKIGANTLLAQIIEMVNKASRSKAPIQKLTDRISQYFVPIVVLVAVLTFFAWVIWGPEPRYVFGFVNAIAVLIIACPCALGLATPMSVMVGVGKGAKNGVLIKNAAALEKLNKFDTLVVDKTGTLTEGKPSVEDVVAFDGFEVMDLVSKIASLNKMSEHPLATAIVNYGKQEKVEWQEVENFDSVSGKGVKGVLNGKNVILGNNSLLKEQEINVATTEEEAVKQAQRKGKTVSYIAIDKKIAGYVVISDKIKTTSKAAIATLQNDGVEVIMITGDNADTARAVAEELGLKKYYAAALPEDKLRYVEEMQAAGKKVAMAGDGINDSPALAQADVGIAMGTGTDVAIESAEVTLVKGDLQGIVKARHLGEKVMRNIHQNLWFAFGYNILGIPIAAGLLFPFFGILLSPMIAAVAMSFSSVSVIVNALRLRTVSL